MGKRLCDIVASLLGLILTAPLFALAAIGIWLSSPGPVIYRARRAGRNGRVFLMHKFRTMRPSKPGESAITASNDQRVFPFGSLLRRLKIDELPQLYDVLRGEMSIVGPRPEDAELVRKYYSAGQWETLRVRPGLASPGSIYNYTHGHQYLDDADPEGTYIERLLPIKLALESVYVRRASLWYDLRIVGRTVSTIALIALGKRRFSEPCEMKEALELHRRDVVTGSCTVVPES